MTGARDTEELLALAEALGMDESEMALLLESVGADDGTEEDESPPSPLFALVMADLDEYLAGEGKGIDPVPFLTEWLDGCWYLTDEGEERESVRAFFKRHTGRDYSPPKEVRGLRLVRSAPGD